MVYIAVTQQNQISVASDDNDSISGTTGEDTLSIKEGNDFLLGKAGDDCFNASAGNDTLKGSKGNDDLLSLEDAAYTFNPELYKKFLALWKIW